MGNYDELCETTNTGIENTIEELREIHSKLKLRLEQYKQGKKDALAPCDEVNQLLSRLVKIAIGEYSYLESKLIMSKLEKNTLKDFREISNCSEEQMEVAALKLIFSSNQQIVNELRSELPKTSQEKISLLERMVHDIPKKCQEDNPALEGYAFPYIKNYAPLVSNELSMLKGSKSDASNKYSHLKNKKIAFVGAGFPLSGIMQNILSGAHITLVDCNQEACDRAQVFINLCHECNILDKNDFSIVCKKAEDINFTTKPTKDEKSIQADIVQLASAITRQVKHKVLKKMADSDDAPKHIIDRYVSGTSKLLYENKIPQSELHKTYRGRIKTTAKMLPETKLDEIKLLRLFYGPVVVPTAQINVNSSRILEISTTSLEHRR